jgi:hypothetical protein
VTYGWVEEIEAFCFTALVGVDLDEAIRRLGGDPSSTAAPRTFDQCFWPADGTQWAQVGPVNGGLFVAEHNGWRAEEVAEDLSRGARMACFFRNVQAVMHFVYAVDGEVLAEFDPLLEWPAASGADPRILNRVAGDLPFGLFGAESSAMALLERLTGVRVEKGWLETPQRAVALPPASP